MKISFLRQIQSIVCTVLVAIATLNVASAQTIRIELNGQQVDQFIEMLNGNSSRPIRVIHPDFDRPIVVPVIDDVPQPQPQPKPQPDPQPVVTDLIPSGLQGTWVETTAAETKYHQLKADGTHNMGVIRNGVKTRFTQQASYANGKLRLAGGTYSVIRIQSHTLHLTNSREERTWVRYDETQPASDLKSQILGVWYEDTREGDVLMVNRYEIKTDGTYDMQAFDRAADGSFDPANPVDNLGAAVGPEQRQYRLTGATLFLAEKFPHREGPLQLKVEGDKLLVTEDGVVRIWKRTP